MTDKMVFHERHLPGQVLLALVLASLLVLIVGLLATSYYWLAFLPALSILTFVFVNHIPKAAFFILVFLLPFENITHLSESNEIFTVSKVLGILLVIVVLLSLLVRRYQIESISSNLWPLLAAFLLFTFLSFLMSDYRSVSMNELRRLGTAGVFFALSLFFVSRKDFIKSLPSLIIFSILFNLLLFVCDYIFKIPLGPGGMPLFPRVADPAAALTANYSGLLIFSLPLLVHRFLTEGKLLKRALYLAAFAMVIFGLVYIKSRAAALTFVILTVLFTFEYFKRISPRLIGFLFTFTAIFVLAVLFFAPAAYWQRQKSVTHTKTDPSISRRVSYLHVAGDIFRESPLFGSGPGTFKEVYGNSPYAAQFAEGGGGLKRYAHNTYLEVLTGSGVFALLTLLLIVLLALSNFHRAKARFLRAGNDREAFLVSAYRLSFISVIFMFLFISHLYQKYFWLSLALSVIALKLSPEETDS